MAGVTDPAPAAVIRHVAFEGFGTLAGEVERRGLAWRYLDPPADALAAARDAPLAAVMGGPIGVGDVDRFAWLDDELALIRHRLSRRLPTLGICLGAQLMARAMGASVAPMPAPEIGWSPLALTAAGRQSVLRHLGGPVLHWHGEMFELPPGCRPLASTPACANQAFAAGDHALALQFHIEVDAAELEHWLVGHIHELDHRGVAVEELRRDAARFAGAAVTEGRALFAEWLTANGFGS